ncbi:MAG: hypothetical protein JSV26_08900 [bacterium]|nr:MAG: hypothetical protein JSV26_08900 [bacterium]
MAQDYDLTLIGARFPQLALGTLMAKRGHSVLIVHQGGENGTTPRNGLSEGYTFRKRPTPLFGLDGMGLLRKFLDEIGIGRMLVRKSYPPNPVSYQVVLPRHRLSVFPKRNRLLEELQREFPRSADSFKNLYEGLDPLSELWYENYRDLPSLERTWQSLSTFSNVVRGMRETRGISKSLAGTGDDPLSVAGFAAVQHHFLGSYPVDGRPDPLSLALIHSIARRGTFQEPTGTSSLSDLMKIRFTEFGGELKDGLRVTAVEARGGEGLAVVGEGGMRIGTRSLSTTCDIASRIQGIDGKGKPADHRSSFFPVRFYLGLDESAIPVGMEDNLFFLREDSGGPLGLRALYIALSPSGSRMAPGGKRAATVTGLVHGRALKGLTAESISRIQADVVDALESVIPFLSDGMDFITSDLRGEIGEALPRPMPGGALSWIPALIGRSRVRTSNRHRIAVLSTPPQELGIEGETLSALAAAGSLTKVLGKGK